MQQGSKNEFCAQRVICHVLLPRSPWGCIMACDRRKGNRFDRQDCGASQPFWQILVAGSVQPRFQGYIPPKPAWIIRTMPYLFFLPCLSFYLAQSLVFSVINRFRGNLPWTFFRLGHLGPLQSNWKTGISCPVVCHLFLLSGSTNESSHLQTTHA